MSSKFVTGLVVGCAALVAACSTTTGGTPTVSDSSAAPSTVAVPAGLDVGRFPTTIREVPSPSNENAWIIEGNRMADALIQVNEVDPRMKIGGAGLRSYPVLTGIQLKQRVPDATYNAFYDNKMRVGMTTTRGDSFDNPTVATRIGLYRFDTPDAAAKALAAIKAATAGQRQIPITGTDGVSATEFKPGTVDSYRVEGPFVINVSGTAPATDDAAKFVAKAYTLEIPKVKSFSPTPVASIQSLPGDKDGILSRTLMQQSSALSSLSNAYYGLDAMLHRIRDISDADIYRKAGVDLVGEGAAIVYRTRDAAAATDMAAALVSTTRADKNHVAAASPTALPQAQCTERRETQTFNCAVAVGRWAATAGGESLAESQQAISAQFTILAKNP
ncbi:DUF7373 family lipoprotein [Tsukamurella pseudospumae]|uniref:PknH-like extracellular domain-containing protein n=1 Tax=Tsukamurella pseudospumae TaxID=239498 RepID=A0A138A016_9ACTN|nr:hypothetical protein [Tsukamurella pseudospumae]KXO89095.1 hypothetical protein AXK61_10790 [Tsukamurella pseudospumae]KXP03793.1 hypothetical protein AXK60_18575 [Tsukamurella pseudospumae]